MTEIPETWATRELPILRAAHVRLEGGADYADLDEIRTELGLTDTDIRQAVDGLRTATPPYIEAEFRNGWDGTRSPGTIDSVLERGRREVGAWPTPENFVAELAAALREAADSTPEPDEKTRLRTAADVLVGFGRDVAVAVVAQRLGG